MSNKTAAAIAIASAFLATYGARIREKVVTINGVEKTICVKVLTAADMDAVRYDIPDDRVKNGIADNRAFATGSNARYVQRGWVTAIDDETPVFDLDTVLTWPDSLVLEIYAAIKSVNATDQKTEDAIAKNSVATPAVASSSN